MRPIQLLLLALLAIGLLVYLRRLRSRTRDRLVVLAAGAVTLALVIFPDASTVIANAVGVGRGVDLVTYLGLGALGFVCLLLYSHVRTLQAQITVLTREIALVSAAAAPASAKAPSGDC